MHAYIGGIIRNLDGYCLCVNGMEDHLHILGNLPTKISVADAVRDIKANASKWIHENWPNRKSFGWQTGYSAFTVSMSQLKTVEEYIRNQKEHHKRFSFEEELTKFLNSHNIAFDARFVFD